MKHFTYAAVRPSQEYMTAPRKLTDNFIATLVDEEVVLIDMAGGELFSLKDTGRAIWDLIDGERTPNEIIAELIHRYEVEPKQAGTDLDDLLCQLTQARLVEL